MTDEELRTLQLKELGVLKEITSLCDRHGIKYFAAGGTLLGCIRHGGFIPWDDDVDLAMPRPDYEKFIKIAGEELPKHLRLENYKLTPDVSNIPFLKVLDDSTELVLNYAEKPIYTNMFIDIFPYDGVPDGKLRLKLYKARILWLRLWRNYADMDNIHMHRVNRPFIERFLIKFGKITHINKILNLHKITDKTEKYIKKFDFYKCRYVNSNYGAYKFREIMPAEYYASAVKRKFEDMELNCPVKGEEVLSNLYGDYMKLPPESERHLQHGMEIRRL
ncbi:MAG: phosphorylcholine transferase LicD [Butyrivibrio sp.]